MKNGFVAIIGRPSAGKSTLLNALCGEKVAITSPVPQTTRNAIRGIINTPEGQVVFLDTPGYHRSDRKLNSYLKDVVHRSLADADAVLYVVDATRSPGVEEQAVMDLLNQSSVPLVVAVNKIDATPSLITEIRGLILTNLNPNAILNISALECTGLSELTHAVLEVCPDGEPHYPEEFYTDQDPEFRISEIIREQAIIRSEQELPHAIYVEIADIELKEPNDKGKDSGSAQIKKNLWVRAFLVVERPSQVGILVGKDGVKVKEIRIAALRSMKKVFPWKIRLDLRVKTRSKWRKNDPLLKHLTGIGPKM